MNIAKIVRNLLLSFLLLMPVASFAQWSKVQQSWNSTAGNASPPATTTTSLPSVAAGDVVIASVMYLGTLSGFTMTVTDGNGHSFTQTPNSPCIYSTGQKVWLFYITASTLATMTVSATASVTHGFSVHAIEFHPTPGTVKFDTDVCSVPTTGTTPINTPSITPAVSGVLYAAAIPDPSAGVGAFTGVVGGSWTVGTFGIIASDNNDSADEWQVSAIVATSVNFVTTGSLNTGWNAMSMSMFTVVPPSLGIKGNVEFKGTVKVK